ncbi:MAG: DUF3108 domain-containing protein [Campylobacteraceae bacterium]|nr:DUF3108 domain-containing protein [Campylobacteraceae bacterium]
MRKLVLSFFISFLFLSPVFGAELSAVYDVKFGIFGKVGEARTKLTTYENNGTYEIYMDAKTFGLANSLSGDRREYFYSAGTTYKGYLLPEIYKHRVERNKRGELRIREKVFELKQSQNQIKLSIYKNKGDNGNSLNKTDERVLNYYGANDLLTLFFNFSKIRKDLDHFILIVAGAKDDNGEIEIKIPSDKEALRIQKSLGTTDKPYIVFINQKIFSSKKGELHVAIGDEGYATKAVLKDVILFGDIVGELVEVKKR